MPDEAQIRSVTRRVLFDEEPDIPGEGSSAAREPERHLRVKVTMNLDGDIVNHFKQRALEEGAGYQWLINRALREFIEGSRTEKLASEVRRQLLDDEVFLARLKRELEEK